MLFEEAAAHLPDQNAVVPDETIAIFRDAVRFWIQRVLVPILTVVGLFGNSITIIIMTRRGMRSTTNMYLAALAFVDMLYLILTFLLGLSHYPNMAAPEYYLYWKMKPFLMMLCDVSSNTSVWLTVTFTIERYIAVEYPMKGKVWCTEARAKVLIIFLFIFSILFAMPVPFEWEIYKKRVIKDSTTHHYHLDNIDKNFPSTSIESDDYSFVWAEKNSSFGNNETYKTIYYRLTAVIFYIIPIILLVYFNFRLCLSVHASKRSRDNMMAGTIHRGNKNLAAKNTTVKVMVEPSSTQVNGKITDKRKMKVQSLDACDDISGQTLLGHAIVTSEPLANQEQLVNDSLVTDNYSKVQMSCDNDRRATALRRSFSEIRSNDRNNLKITIENTTAKTTDMIDKDIDPLVKTTPALKKKMTGSPNCSGSNPLKRNSSGVVINHSTQERRITVMLISVVMLFLICQLPSAIMLLYTATHDLVPNTYEHALVLAFGNIFNFLMAVNAAGNFVLYSSLSKKYRRTFVKLFCNCFKPGYKQGLGNRNPFSVRIENSGQLLKTNSSTCSYLTNKSVAITRDTLL